MPELGLGGPTPPLHRPLDTWTQGLSGGQCQADWLPDQAHKTLVLKSDAQLVNS